MDESGSNPFNVDEYLCLAVQVPTIPGPIVPESEVTVMDSEEESYEKFVRPFILGMSSGQRFNPGQAATSACKKFCPSMKARLEADLQKAGLEKPKVKSMMKWFDRMKA